MTVGIDEAGRGAWAGPFVAAAVILDKPIAGLTDSKALTPKKRAFLLRQIQQNAKKISVSWVSAADVDKYGLTYAQEQAMTTCLAGVDGPDVTSVILDGSIMYVKDDSRVEVLIKADAKFACVSAASIVAKELRDSYMKLLGIKHPNYGLEVHMGYGTAVHRAALEQSVPVVGVHRFSYKPVKLAYERA